jgi:putative membrane protein
MKIIDTFRLALKGVAMGAADVVPGVSGGTIAFITGIYEELLGTISSFNLDAFRVLKNEGVKALWKHINGNFLVTLLFGIGISILSLTKLIKYLLEFHPVLIWSFFFGLVLASTWLVGKQIKKRSIDVIVLFVFGTAVAYWITTIETTANVDAMWYFFLSGAIAICAMILPGISGSFILLLLGSYHAVIDAIHDKNVKLLAVFAAGCIVGLLSFSRLLKWLFANYKAGTLAVLTGFLLGSLNKIWPWKVNIGDAPLVIHSNGKEDWLQQNVSPLNYDGDAQLVFAVVLLCVGAGLIFLMERFSPKEG